MNYHKISKFDTANGVGIGSVLWVSGCNHHCKGCHNPETWDENSGRVFTKNTLDELLESISEPYITRVTFSGGDPLYPSNRSVVLKCVEKIKGIYPNKKIWIYTGYTFETIHDLEILHYTDVLVDGPFVNDLKYISLPFCGSTNQRVIDVVQTLKAHSIVLWHN